ncbi:MAG: hypothetical protein ABII79_04250 [bacterium]
MRITASLICAIMLSALAFAAPSQVTNVALQYQDGSATARIDIKGPVRFTHQTEDAKDGKPFRVIVDILSATHQLPAKNYTTLPECPVESIRSSQYAVIPEKVVRLVFDMEQSTFYRVTSGDDHISLFFPDKLHRQFTAWSSREWAAAQGKPAADQTKPEDPTIVVSVDGKQQPIRKTSTELNSAIDQDRLFSLAGEPAPEKAPSKSAPPVKKPPAVRTTSSGDVQTTTPKTPTVTEAPTVSVTVVDTPYGPEFDENLLNLTVPQPLTSESGVDNKQPPEPVSARKSPVKTPVVAETSAKTSTKPVATTAGTPVPESQAGFEKPAAKPKAPSSQILTRKPKTETPAPLVSIPAGQKQTSTKATPEAPPTSATLAVTDNQPSQKPAVDKPVEKAPDRKQAAPTKTEKSKSYKDTTGMLKEEPGTDKEDKSTSRFRRSPTSPTKIKGTLVAEFPKRLVIKYKVGNSRDPFETLINESKVSNNPIEKRIPNVEGLELVGVLESEAGSNSALFEDKDGYGYILKEGDKVRNGYVLRVESDRVYFQIFEYGWSRTVALNMDEY